MRDELTDARHMLSRVRDRLGTITEVTTGTVVSRATDPDAMRRAYAAISGEVSGDEGRRALRQALEAEGLDPDQIDAIDALYVACLLPGLEG